MTIQYTDLTDKAGFKGDDSSYSIDAIRFNGAYWLLGGVCAGEPKLVKYDGTTFTDLTDNLIGFTTQVMSIEWNGQYWLIAGAAGEVNKWDETTWTDLTATFDNPSATFHNIRWNGSVFILVGTNVFVKYDGTTVTDLNAESGFWDWPWTCCWNGEYWLISGHSGILKKYDGESWTDLSDAFKAFVPYPSIAEEYGYATDIQWSGQYWLLAAFKGNGQSLPVLVKYDGTTFTDLSDNLLGLIGSVRFCRWNGNIWLVIDANATGGMNIYHNGIFIALENIGINVGSLESDGVNLSLIGGMFGKLKSVTIELKELIIQPSSKDTHASERFPDSNYGTVELIRVDDQYVRNFHPILEFDISEVPSGAIIVSASLQLYYYEYSYTNPSGKTVWAYKLTRTDWVETEATWNIYKIDSNWTTPGGDYVTSDPSGDSTLFPADYGWMYWDVKAIVEDAVNLGWNLAEFLVRFETEGLSSGYSAAYFYSNNYTENWSLRPKLVIEYMVEVEAIIKVADEAIGIGETIFGVLSATLSDKIGIVDSLVRRSGFVRIISEAIGIVDGFIRRSRLAKTFSEAVTIAETSIRHFRAVRLITESLSIMESAVKRLWSVRLSSEVLGIIDSLIRKASLAKIFSETVGIAESLIRRSRFIKLFSEAINITDSVIRQAKSVRIIGETLGIAETLIRRLWSIRITAETISIVETAIKRSWAFRLIAETVGITDTLVRRLWSIRIKAETVNILDSGVHFFRGILIKIMAEMITIADSLMAIARIKTWLRIQTSRLDTMRLNVSRMAINRMKSSRMPLYRWITRRWS